MSFEAFRDWAFLALITAVVYLLYSIMISFRDDLKELSRAIVGLRDDLVKYAAQMGVQDTKIDRSDSEHQRSYDRLQDQIDELKRYIDRDS